MSILIGDEFWASLKGGYGLPYDPRATVQSLEIPAQRDKAWAELWSELHHQGDVGDASYAAIPLLVRVRAMWPALGWQFYSICATIETERHRKKNPPLPAWLAAEYESSWAEVLNFALSDPRVSSDPLLLRSAVAAVAVAKGNVKFGALVGFLDESEIDKWVEEHLSWSELYGPAV